MDELGPIELEFIINNPELASADGGLTPDKIAALKLAYGKVITDAGVEFGNLEKVVGTISGSTSNTQTLAGQMQGVSESTANGIEGAFNLK